MYLESAARQILWYWFDLEGFRLPCATILAEFEFRATHAIHKKSVYYFFEAKFGFDGPQK